VSRRSPWAAHALASVAFLCVARTALADPSPKDRAQAKADWTHGKQLMAVKDFAGAADAFQSAEDRDPRALYKLDLARAFSETGKLVEAETLFEEVEKGDESGSDREKALAKSLSDKLIPRIPTLKLVAKGPPDDAVHATIESTPAKVGVAIRENPGRYHIEATADGFAPTKVTASVAEGEAFDVNLPFKATGEAGGGDSGPRHGGNMLPAAISFGVGGTGILLGTIFGILAFQATSDLNAVCKANVCPITAADDINTDEAYGNTSTATFVIGGVGVAAGVVLALTVGRGSSKSDDKTPEKAFVVPYAWPGGVGVVGRF
jgi:hypothetical protein